MPLKTKQMRLRKECTFPNSFITKCIANMGFITEFKALKQIDATPDYGIKGPEWDLFKITMSDIVRNSVAGRLNC